MQKEKSGAVVAILSLCVATAANADIEYEAEVGVGYSDNILRDGSDEQDETLATVGLRLNWEELTRRLDGNVRTDLSYVEYLSGEIDSEVLGSADAEIEIGLVPERFLWSFADNFGQARSDPFQPVSPENRENINTFSTGPEVRLRFGSVMQARLQALYTSVNYSNSSDLDIERTGAVLSLVRELAADNSFGINFSVDESDMKNPLSQDYSRESAALSYSKSSGRTTLDVQAGYSTLKLDNAPPNDGPLFDLTFTRQLTRSSSLSINASNSFMDAGEMLQNSSDELTATPGSVIADADPFENRGFGIEWRFARGRTSFGVGAQQDDSVYETDSSLDSTRTSFTADFSRQLWANLTLELEIQKFDEEYATSDFDVEEWSAGSSLSWQFSRHLGVRLRLDYTDRTTSNGLSESDEMRAMLSVTYGDGG